ncbi:ribose 5-phosphate isomerase B [Allorhodopirellula solitaria]|uniref:Putative sugar phosphate isomerase YwlF n=1 Tax=Allorhodopirellula solitaria TaxID=2527987 RepID=A0A5C5YGI4_9BACT|nr:ribose 5-phosphate isomerase B [Allorhodopirellula solitaria]TWT74109.1 putative sugar phosphate isomerase YwlF [Allorhodopirellula solitaria]
MEATARTPLKSPRSNLLKIGLASDHRGVHIKARLVQSLTHEGYDVFDAGTDSSEPVDYPDFAIKVAQRIAHGELDRGILICGTGIGMSIVANKFPGVRAASCYDEVMVEMSRRHNDVNVLCLPGDLIGERSIDDLVMMWLNTEFECGRHGTRVAKICELESTLGKTAHPRCGSAAEQVTTASPTRTS